MVIHGLQKLTLLDYPGHTACTVFTAHCPWRCPFCHNASLVLNPESQPVIPEEEIFSFLAHRKGLLDGVAVTGGEPTLQRASRSQRSCRRYGHRSASASPRRPSCRHTFRRAPRRRPS